MKTLERNHIKLFAAALLTAVALAVSPVGFAQTDQHKAVTMSLDKAPVTTFFNEMKKQTGLDFLCAADLVKSLPTVTIHVNNVDAERVLDNVMGKLGCNYAVKDGIVTVTGKQNKAATYRYISGYVRDDHGESLPGAPVRIKGTDLQTVTDGNGFFTLRAPVTTCELSCEYIGMDPAAITIKAGQKSLDHNITMTGDHTLKEVVVTGYQTISRERATGSYSIINADDLKSRHASNLSDALNGLIAGMQANDDGRGGKTFTIRGTSTMNADKTPLVVIDGFPVMDNQPTSNNSKNPNMSALERINPDDVESITILKDAAAASIWGARSANGVIVITTKKNKNKNSFSVEGNTQLTIGKRQDVAHLTNLATASQMINYQKWAFQNNMIGEEYTGDMGSLFKAITQSELLLYKGYKWGTLTQDEMNAQLAALAACDNRKQISNELLRTPVNSSTTASVSGNVGLWNTRASVNYIYDAGDFIGHHDNTWRLNWDNNFRFNKWIAFNAGFNLVGKNAHSSLIGFSDLTTLSPYEMLLNADGSYATNFHDTYNSDVLSKYDWSGFTYKNMNYNLLQEARSRNNRTTNTQGRIQLGLELDLMDGLQFNSKFQYEKSRYHNDDTNSEESFYTRYHVNYLTPGDLMGNALGASVLPAGAIVINREGKNHSTLFRNDLSLNRTFGKKHAVAAVIGNEVSNYYYESWTKPYRYGVTATSTGVEGKPGHFDTMDASTSTIYGVPAEGKQYVSQTWNHNRYVSFYGNASYMYDERYGLSASARSDASNLITKEAKYRWSPLWSVGAMWNMANEKWMKDKTPFDRLTLRLTYGKNGNAASSSSAFTTISTVSDYVDEYTGLYPGKIYDYGNPTLRWEKTASTDFGIDFSLFNNHLYGTVDYYNKKSTDVLGTVAIAGVYGTNEATYNNAELNNRGVEVTLGSKAAVGDFSFEGVLTYAYNKNKVTKIYNEISNVSDIMNAYYFQGYPMGAIFKMRYGGMKNGMPQILDKDGNSYDISDLSIYDKDWHDFLTYEGTTVAPHTAGLTLSLGWKDLMLTAYVNGRFGGKMQMPTFSYLYPDNYGAKASVSAQVGEVMNSDGSLIANPKHAMPLPTVDGEGNAIDVSAYGSWSTAANIFSMNVESADYIYLQEIDLAYSLPQSLFKNRWMKSADIFCKLDNVGMIWAANSKDYHPDYLPGSYQPRLAFTMGVNVKF